MAIETIPFKELEKITDDTFESVVIMCKRARQVNAERLAKMELPAFMEDTDDEEPYEREDLIDFDFDTIEKATTFAIREMLNGDLSYRYKDVEPELSEDDQSKVHDGESNSE